MDFHGFYTGKIFDAYQYLGAHITDAGVVFRTFAPGAQKVSLIGECSQWREYDMNRVYDGNFWERYVDSVKPGSMYKYRIRTAQIFHLLLAVISNRQNRRKALKLLDLLRNQNHPKLSSFIRCYP